MDHTVPQDWHSYTPAEHEVWRTLYTRQSAILPGLACDAFLDGLRKLDLAGGIPDFDHLSDRLHALTGWRVVAVPGLVPDAVFYEHLANRRFPAGRFIRGAHQLDYLEEPDVFHDVFGHVPMLTDPIFADYMQAYGKGGLRAQNLGRLHNLARLYWYTWNSACCKPMPACASTAPASSAPPPNRPTPCKTHDRAALPSTSPASCARPTRSTTCRRCIS